jgi:hypothetical protein
LAEFTGWAKAEILNMLWDEFVADLEELEAIDRERYKASGN